MNLCGVVQLGVNGVALLRGTAGRLRAEPSGIIAVLTCWQLFFCPATTCRVSFRKMM